MSKAKPTAAPCFLLPWDRGEALLAQGYSVGAMPETWCYQVNRPSPTDNPDGPTTAYHVCLDRQDHSFGCSCPDWAQHGDQRPCKHFLGVCVQLWRWAEESPLRGIVDFGPILEELGIPAMRAASLRARAGGLISASGRPMERRDPSEYRNPPWPKNATQTQQKERVPA